jgi:PEP-CTERM motif
MRFTRAAIAFPGVSSLEQGSIPNGKVLAGKPNHRGTTKPLREGVLAMKLILAALMGAMLLLLCATSTHANVIRTSSNYGTLSGATDTAVQGSPADPSAQVVVCIGDKTNCGTNGESGPTQTDPTLRATISGYDLLVAIQSDASSFSLDLGADAVTAPLVSSEGSYGVWGCNGSGLDNNWNTDSLHSTGVQFCSDSAAMATTNCNNALSAGPSDASISIPTACLVPGIVLYFDEKNPDEHTITLGTSTTAVPEPNSLGLLGAGILGLLSLQRRRR